MMPPSLKRELHFVAFFCLSVMELCTQQVCMQPSSLFSLRNYVCSRLLSFGYGTRYVALFLLVVKEPHMQQFALFWLRNYVTFCQCKEITMLSSQQLEGAVVICHWFYFLLDKRKCTWISSQGWGALVVEEFAFPIHCDHTDHHVPLAHFLAPNLVVPLFLAAPSLPLQNHIKLRV